MQDYIMEIFIQGRFVKIKLLSHASFAGIWQKLNNIYYLNKNITHASEDMAIAIELNKQIDVSRGDIISSVNLFCQNS